MSDLYILTASDVDKAQLKITALELQHLMSRVFATVTDLNKERNKPQTETQTPHRITISTQNHTALFMPARIVFPIHSEQDIRYAEAMKERIPGPAAGEAVTSIKVVSAPKESAPPGGGLPGTTLVLDEETGGVRAILNARKLTAVRNAAGSLVSTSMVASRSPKYVVAFGAGAQVEAHLDLHIRYFPQGLERCTVINRTVNDRAKKMIITLAKRHLSTDFHLYGSEDKIAVMINRGKSVPIPVPDYSPDTTISKALQDSDLVICATPSKEPLFSSKDIRQGTHIILIGSYTPEMKEIGTDLLKRALPPQDDPERANYPESFGQKWSRKGALLLVDDREAALKEAGELISAQIDPADIGEIGQVIPRFSDGTINRAMFQNRIRLAALRTHESYYPPDLPIGEGYVTIYKSVGVGLQDVAIAHAVIEQAKKMKLGQTIVGYDEAD